MKTIKVIDLFLMEDKPKKIKVDGLEYESCLCNDCNSKLYTDYSHFNPKTKITSLFWARYLLTNQNAEVEIIEEDKEIEEIEIYSDEEDFDEKIHFKNIMRVSKNGELEVTEEISVIVDKINELVRELNELKKGK